MQSQPRSGTQGSMAIASDHASGRYRELLSNLVETAGGQGAAAGILDTSQAQISRILGGATTRVRETTLRHAERALGLPLRYLEGEDPIPTPDMLPPFGELRVQVRRNLAGESGDRAGALARDVLTAMSQGSWPDPTTVRELQHLAREFAALVEEPLVRLERALAALDAGDAGGDTEENYIAARRAAVELASVLSTSLRRS